MRRSRIAGLSLSMLLVLSACTTSVAIDESAQVVEQNRTPVAAVEPTALPQQSTPPTATAAPLPTPAPTATAIPTAVPPTPVPPTPTPVPTLAAIAAVDHSGLAGTRGLTLQWISWEPEDWGSIDFVPLTDGSYAVSGTQDGPDGDFVAVDGTMVRVGDRELRFNGTVTVQVSYNNDGQPCVRAGEIVFLATGDRRFWRMQDLLNCDDIVTDYVDIYFG